jgi:hypothetical protein
VVLPAKLRRRSVSRKAPSWWPKRAKTVEVYTPERRAEFLLNNAVDIADYQRARAEVKRMGLDPDRIKHHRPEPARLRRPGRRRG